ncbi:Similar to S.cerevisiae protein RET3 (Zeta subunit of the coatomer complex (COPI)) [Malassezia sympodialis ATCC 42132]|uniref:Coatomer subunit zeta n=1 Tax=Malassezia sympodialis (strain ATCC 42132) TaxID=1230383 RepID=A0A1M8AA49_MALS4|nr:Similar to S.cerevisiae protein RET3 (Zeta subunit of the coatomer complex (COPI)) [Malassezia sympodialis ATCC 42132]
MRDMNLTLYSTRAVLLLDSEGHRILAKYYEPPGVRADGVAAPAGAGAAGLAPLYAKNPYQTQKQQEALEHGVWDKARRASGDLFQYDNQLVLFKASYDVYLFVIAPEHENELMIHSFLQSFYDTLSVLLQSQIDKRTILDNMDLVTLALDESIDDGIILETDSAAIANRVTRPRSDTIEVQINEQTLLNAYTNFREKTRVAQRLSGL